jgi:hypothetical protein
LRVYVFDRSVLGGHTDGESNAEPDAEPNDAEPDDAEPNAVPGPYL